MFLTYSLFENGNTFQQRSHNVKSDGFLTNSQKGMLFTMLLKSSLRINGCIHSYSVDSN